MTETITFEYTPDPERRALYEKTLKKIFPELPLYLFLAVSGVLFLFMLIQHLHEPAARSLVLLSISLFSFLFGGSILYCTKKSRLPAEERLLKGLGLRHRVTVTEREVTIEREGAEPEVWPRAKLFGQYCTDRCYIFCLADHLMMVPVIADITAENLDELNRMIQSTQARGTALKRLKVS